MKYLRLISKNSIIKAIFEEVKYIYVWYLDRHKAHHNLMNIPGNKPIFTNVISTVAY